MTRRPLFAAVAAIGALAGSIAPAAGERLVASLSNHRVMVTSNFTGEELVLFGGIEQDGAARTRRGGYDIIVTVTGPRQTVVTFRKARALGIWVNTDSRPPISPCSRTGPWMPSPTLKRYVVSNSASTTSRCRNAPV